MTGFTSASAEVYNASLGGIALLRQAYGYGRAERNGWRSETPGRTEVPGVLEYAVDSILGAEFFP